MVRGQGMYHVYVCVCVCQAAQSALYIFYEHIQRLTVAKPYKTAQPSIH